MTDTKKIRDYMGVIVMNHYQASPPVACVDLDKPAIAMCEFALYQGSLCQETGRVHKETLLGAWQMSEMQWGMLMSRPNFSLGQPVTFTALDKHTLFEPVKDHAESRLGEAVSSVLSADPQLVNFLDESHKALQQAHQKGRLGSHDCQNVVRALTSFVNNLQPNADHDMSVVLEEANKRAREAAHDIYRAGQRAGSAKTMPLTLAPIGSSQDTPAQKSASTLGLMQINVGGQGGYPLFMDTASHGHVSIEVDYAQQKDSATGGKRLMSCGCALELRLSPGQYARMVRAEAIEIECTLLRVFGHVASKPEQSMLMHQISSKGEVPSREDLALRQQVEAIVSRLTQGNTKGKAVLSELEKDIGALKAQYQQYLQAITPARQAKLEHVMQSQQQWLAQEVEKQVALLPQAQQAAIEKTLSGILALHQDRYV